MTEQDPQSRIHYIHRLSASVQQRIVGVFVLSAVLIIAGIIALQLHDSHLLDDRIEYHAYLANAQGVSTETLISVSGIEVGRVDSIDITPDNRIHVRFFVYDRFQRLLRSDSTGALNKLSLIGNAVIMIKAGSSNLPILEAGATIPIEEPLTTDDLIAKLKPVITTLNNTVEKIGAIIDTIEPEQIRTVALDVTVMMDNLRDISARVAKGQGLAGKILVDERMEQEVAGMVSDIDPIIQNLNAISQQTLTTLENVDRIVRSTEEKIQSVAAIIEPTSELIDQSNAIAEQVHAITRQVNNEVQQLPEMVDKMQSLLDTTNRTLENAQQVWPLSTVVAPGNRDTVIRERPLDD